MLAIIAASLYLLALLITVAGVTFLKVPLLRAYDSYNDPYLEYAKTHTVVPVTFLAYTGLDAILSGVFVLLTFRLRSDRASLKWVIVLAVLLSLLMFSESAILQLESRIRAAQSFDAYNVCNHLQYAISSINSRFTPIAYILMLLAMGGFCNRGWRANHPGEPEPEPPARLPDLPPELNEMLRRLSE